MKIILWICLFALLLATLPMAWLGIQWVEVGQGLHPILSGLGIAILIGLAGYGAWLIDEYEPD